MSEPGVGDQAAAAGDHATAAGDKTAGAGDQTAAGTGDKAAGAGGKPAGPEGKPAGPEDKAAGNTPPPSTIKTSIFWSVLIVVMLAAPCVGWLIGLHLTSTAHQHQDCALPTTADSWQGLTVSGVPTSLQSSFGYGRGTQAIESYISVTAQKGVSLPKSVTVYAAPLATSDGTQVILPIQGRGNPPKPTPAITAIAVQASSSIYRLEVCVRAPNAAPGSYVSQLMFPGVSSASGSGSSAATPPVVPITVTFQSEAVPYILTMGLVPLSLLGMIYTTLIFVRRSNPNQGISGLAKSLYVQLWSINGISALIVSIGAVFTAWNLQCFRNPTWGTPWPVVLTALVTMAGAAAGASSIPMGFAKDPAAKTN